MNETYSLDHQYLLYLKRMNLKESEMNPTQRIETKRAFMGGVSQALHLMARTDLDVGELVDGTASMLEQLDIFWNKQIKQ